VSVKRGAALSSAKLVCRAPDTGTVSVSWTLQFVPARSVLAAPIDRGF
jgi:hypothetical protein